MDREEYKQAMDEIYGGEVVNSSFSRRAPGVKLDAQRYIMRDFTTKFYLYVSIVFLLGGLVSLALWSKIAGGIFLAISIFAGWIVWKVIQGRTIAFRAAVLAPGIVISEKPLEVLILTSMSTGMSDDPHWGLKKETPGCIKPYTAKVGTRVPCVTSFQGEGPDYSWGSMVCDVLTTGTGKAADLNGAMARLDDEEEWQILEKAIAANKIPGIGETLRFHLPPPLPANH